MNKDKCADSCCFNCKSIRSCKRNSMACTHCDGRTTKPKDCGGDKYSVCGYYKAKK